MTFVLCTSVLPGRRGISTMAHDRRSLYAVRRMPVLSEDTFELMCLIEENDALYNDCFRITAQTLEKHPPKGDSREGIGCIATTTRDELSQTLRSVLLYSDDAAIGSHLADARVDWRDVAREFIADVLYGDGKRRQARP